MGPKKKEKEEVLIQDRERGARDSGFATVVGLSFSQSTLFSHHYAGTPTLTPQTKGKAMAFTPPTTAQLKSGAYNFLRILIFLIVLSRVWALLITYHVVPDFPDPVLASLARLYEGFDSLVENGIGGGAGNVVLGNVVFAMFLRFYAPKAGETKEEEEVENGVKKSELQRAAEKNKKAKKGPGPGKAIREDNPDEGKGDIDIRVGSSSQSSLKRNIIISGKLAQGIIFLTQNFQKGEMEKVRVRIIELGVSLVLIALELSGLKWEGGLLDKVFEGIRAAFGGDETVEKKEAKEAEAKLKLR